MMGYCTFCSTIYALFHQCYRLNCQQSQPLCSKTDLTIWLDCCWWCILDAIFTSPLSRLNDWPLNSTEFLFGHKKLRGCSTQPSLHFKLRLLVVFERQRSFLEFAIKTGYVLDPWKTVSCPWVFSCVLESSWTVVKLFIIKLLIKLNIQESRSENVVWQTNVYNVHIIVALCATVIQQCLLEKMCYTTYLQSIQSRHEVKFQ